MFKNRYTKYIILIAVITLLFAFKSPLTFLDHQIDNLYKLFESGKPVSGEVVLIKITNEDINKLGSWPLKRSYYALLINNLKKYQVRKIGLEIFLSTKYVTQTLYDQLITEEIKSDNIVLSSVAGNIFNKGNSYTTDSLSYPSPKILDENISSGHINFIEEESKLFIPDTLLFNEKHYENSFAYKLSGIPNNKALNITASWNKIKSYSLIEFINKVDANDPELNELKNKIVIIGVTDPSLTRNYPSIFDGQIPGLAMHAFSVENRITKNYLVDDYYFISKIILALIVLLFAFLIKRNNLHIIIFISFIVVTLAIFLLLNVQLSYTFFLIPFGVLVIYDIMEASYLEKRKLLDYRDEHAELKSMLEEKEEEVENLERELLKAEELNKAALEEKLNLLKEELDRIKEEEMDVVPEESSLGDVEDFYGLVYKSEEMAEIVDHIKKFADEDAHILIIGASGTGKELVAKAIHNSSKRNEQPFIEVNCGALSESLLESELFGHVKGAFTGAVNDKVGRFEAANNGTLFLDEIGEISENFQVKLLRVIQYGAFEKVGSSKTDHTNVRIIAATNKNLEKAVKEGKFREDLYYRLNILRLEIPALRDRRDDILVLADYFLKKESEDLIFSKAVSEIFDNYVWKGNVRELEAVVKRAAIFARASQRNIVQIIDLPEEIVKTKKIHLDEMVFDSMVHKRFSHSSIMETAEELEISRNSVTENLRGYLFKLYVLNNFSVDEAISEIKDIDNETRERIKTKLQLFLKNIESDVKKSNIKTIEEAKEVFKGKYKNLPAKFHQYLNSIIKHCLK